ncbi:hypothetical protein KIPB_011826, partial [Kipferlia bialata]
ALYRDIEHCPSVPVQQSLPFTKCHVVRARCACIVTAGVLLSSVPMLRTVSAKETEWPSPSASDPAAPTPSPCDLGLDAAYRAVTGTLMTAMLGYSQSKVGPLAVQNTRPVQVQPRPDGTVPPQPQTDSIYRDTLPETLHPSQEYNRMYMELSVCALYRISCVTRARQVRVALPAQPQDGQTGTAEGTDMETETQQMESALMDTLSLDLFSMHRDIVRPF